jgi:hypothetical protein
MCRYIVKTIYNFKQRETSMQSIMIGHERSSRSDAHTHSASRRCFCASPVVQPIPRRSLLAPAHRVPHPCLSLLVLATPLLPLVCTRTPPTRQPPGWPRVLWVCVGPGVPRHAWAGLDGRRCSRSRLPAAIHLLHRYRTSESRYTMLQLPTRLPSFC